jgi:hypothetical protein
MSNLTILVRDVTYFYIKYYYEEELKKKNVATLEENELKQLINWMYSNKSTELKKYIRDTLKENLKNDYNSIAVENIIVEMFSDPEYSKHRVFLEIMEFQKNK